MDWNTREISDLTMVNTVTFCLLSLRSPLDPSISYPADRHLVGGEGARLVGADDRGAAQGLHGGQGPDDGVLLGHAAGAQGQAGGDDGRQTWTETVRETRAVRQAGLTRSGRVGDMPLFQQILIGRTITECS